MPMWFRRPLAAAALSLLAAPPLVHAQPAAQPLPPLTVCGQQTRPSAQPAAGSGPVVLIIAPCFEAQGNASVIEPQTYLYYIKLLTSRPSEGVWIPYDDTSEKTIIDDFHRLWNTNFLDNLWIETSDYQFANVTHEIKEVAGGPKLVHITFNMDEGPKVRIRSIDFVGNKAIGEGVLKRQLKENKERGPFQDFLHFPTWFLSLIGDKGTYQETKFDEDAEKVVAYYRDHGYLRANLGVPELKVLEDSADKKTRWIDLKIPVTEGPRYKVGTFD